MQFTPAVSGQDPSVCPSNRNSPHASSGVALGMPALRGASSRQALLQPCRRSEASAAAELQPTPATMVVTIRSGTIAPVLVDGQAPEKKSLGEQTAAGEVTLYGELPEGTVQILAGLLASRQCRIQKLALRNAGIDDADAAVLSEALKVNCSLAELDLGANQIGVAGAASLSEALEANRTLSVLELLNNRIGPAGAAALSVALKGNDTLTELGLMDDRIGAAGSPGKEPHARQAQSRQQPDRLSDIGRNRGALERNRRHAATT